MKTTSTWFGFGLLILTAIPAVAQIVITAPDVALLPNTAGQTFSISLSNSGAPVPVTGITVNLQTADGGPEAGVGHSISAPKISDINILSGTIFASNNNGLSGSGSIVPQVFSRGTLVSSGTVSIPGGASTLVGVVTIDTTGFFSSPVGGWVLTLNTLNGATLYTTTGADLLPTLVDGHLSIVPEPGDYGIMIGISCIGFAVARRSCRGR